MYCVVTFTLTSMCTHLCLRREEFFCICKSASPLDNGNPATTEKHHLLDMDLIQIITGIPTIRPFITDTNPRTKPTFKTNGASWQTALCACHMHAGAVLAFFVAILAVTAIVVGESVLAVGILCLTSDG